MVPSKARKGANSAIEIKPLAIHHNSFENSLQTAINDLGETIEQHTADSGEKNVTYRASDMAIRAHFIQPTEPIKHSGVDFSGSGTFMQNDRTPTFNGIQSKESICLGDKVQIF